MRALPRTRMLILTALFSALTAVGAFLKIPIGVSSVTLQFFFTALAGLLLGARYGALSQAVYLLLGLFGLPIFTQGGGLGYLLHPTCGFLFGLIPSAWVIGTLAGGRAEPRVLIPACLAGLAVLYLVGLPYMHLILNFYLGRAMSVWATMKAGMLIFLPGDGVKILVVTVVAKPLLRALGRA